ncbi:hypothetical protein [Vibrio sp. VB16]|uniref:hypothetical protein n=1 Tax=Vibrio sp. VB16 TaxID=2785746 RepID=UPI003FCDCD26
MKKPTRHLIKLPNPINSNPSLDAEHTVYIGTTGSGKTTAVKVMDTIPKSGAQVAFFDPYLNYAGSKFKGQMVQVFRSHQKDMFIRALFTARKKNNAFKISYIPESATESELEFFCSVIWSLGDGHRAPFHTVIEELASCVETAGKLKGKAGELLRGGRQFGIVVHTVFQRTQEVPKTVISQSDTWWVGALASAKDAEYIANAKGISLSQLTALKSAKANKLKLGKPIAEYLLIKNGIGNVHKSSFDCSKQ